MALPVLDATFASAADLPRRQMLAKWIVEELGEIQAPSSVLVSGAGTSAVNGTYLVDGTFNGKTRYTLVGGVTGTNSIAWYGTTWQIVSTAGQYTSFDDVAYPWLVTSWLTSGGSNPVPTVTEIQQLSPISNYYSLPERYLWAKIAVAAGGPKTEADYISLPTRYVWSDIYNAVSGDIAQSTVVVSGLSDSQYNGSYVYDGEFNGKPSYRLNANISIYWEPVDNAWIFGNPAADEIIASDSNVNYPWLASNWYELGANGFNPTGLVITVQPPNHTDWSENVALGHIAAAYRGDTGNPANLATYIDWPWRYKVASIIDHLIGNYNAVIVSGAGTSSSNGTYVKSGTKDGKPRYILGDSFIEWSGGELNTWDLVDSAINDYAYFSNVNSRFPWGIAWIGNAGSEPPPILTPTNV